MKKLIYTFTLFLVIGLTFSSCNETQKKDLKNVQENIEKNVKNAAKTVEKEAKKAGKEIEKGADKVGDAVEKGAKEVGEVVKEGAEKVKKEFASADYQCPMKCEGDKVYHEEGKCPKCRMKLKKIN